MSEENGLCYIFGGHFMICVLRIFKKNEKSFCEIYLVRCNWLDSQMPECTCSISHNAPFRTEMCTFLFWMEHCGIRNTCILGFVKLVYCRWSILAQVIVLVPLNKNVLPEFSNVPNVVTVLWKLSHISHTWWRHQNGNIVRVTGHLCGEFTGPRWIPRTKASDAMLWCFLWSASEYNGSVNNREAGDLRRYRAHHDVTVMKLFARSSPTRGELFSRKFWLFQENLQQLKLCAVSRAWLAFRVLISGNKYV